MKKFLISTCFIILAHIIFTVNIVIVKANIEYVTEKEITFYIGQNEYTGLYTGQLKGGLAHGNGRIEYKNSAGRDLLYVGQFQDGFKHGLVRFYVCGEFMSEIEYAYGKRIFDVAEVFCTIITRERLVGTWRREDRFLQPEAVYVFREDGTGLQGASGMRRDMTWRISDGRLSTSIDGTLNRRYALLENGNLEVRWSGRAGRVEIDIYVFYSDDTDIYEATTGWGHAEIFLAVLVSIFVGFVIFALIYIKIKKPSKE